MSTVTSPAAKTLPARLRMLALIPLLLSFIYSVSVMIQDGTPSQRLRMLAGGLPVLHALMFQQGATLDIYDTYTADGLVRTAAGALTNPEELILPSRILSTKAALVSENRHARVRSMTSAYSYDPLEGKESPLILLARNMNYTFALMDEQHPPHLRIDFAECGTIADIPLGEHLDWYKPEMLFQNMGLPQQRKMLLSPAETSLALNHHDTSPRITLVRLLERNAFTLSVPSFDPEQLHFSPFFIDDETLLFSVLDRNHWGTVRYRIRTGTYEILSENFTDHAYHTLSGDILLQQSFYNEVTNVPFGAITLLERFHGIVPREIESLIGPKESHPDLFALLFQDPDAPRLHFKTDLTSQSFNVIAESDLREILRTYWRDYQLELTHPVGEFRFVKLLPDDTLESNGVIPFDVHAPATFAQFTEDAEPLLRALALPDKLIEEYRKRSANARQKGQEYLLVDDLSY